MNALNFEYFFASAENIPLDLQLSLYGYEHLVWLVSIVLSIGILSLYYRNLKSHKKTGFKQGFAVIILFFELLRQLTYIQLGRYEWGLLPLHLCGITEFLIFGYAFTKHKLFKESLYALGMIGALMALLFADWLVYPVLHFQSIHSFVMHGLLLGFVVMLLVSGELKPDPRLLPLVFMALVVFLIPIYYLNQALLTNFFFLAYPSPGSPLVMFEEIAGNPGYIFLTMGLLFVVWFMMYLPFLGKRRRSRVAHSLPIRRSV